VDQDYPGLEILVADGGSTDDSVEVIRSFEPHLTWWCSEKDNGQTHAINKGLARATGTVVNWLCSDDVLLPGALRTVGAYFAEHPDVDVVAGAGGIYDENNPEKSYIWRTEPRHLGLLPAHNGIIQQRCFWRTSLHQRTPPLDESFHFSMDTELWCYFKTIGARWAFLPDILGRYIQTGENKQVVGGIKIAREYERVYRRYTNDRISLAFWYRTFRYPFERLLRRDRGLLRRGLLGIIQIVWMLVFLPFYGYGKVRYMSWPE
jgi:glycosyltransferase involved in cell wall biosynthesis